MLIFSSYQSREIIAQWGKKEKSQILCYGRGFQSGSEVEYPLSFQPSTCHWRFSVWLPLSACPQLITIWNAPATGWNEIPDKFMSHVTFVPLAADHGSAICTSNQSHRLCVTLGEVGTHVQTADSPSPRSQNDCGHGPSFIVVCFLSYKKPRWQTTLHSSELRNWQLERRMASVIGWFLFVWHLLLIIEAAWGSVFKSIICTQRMLWSVSDVCGGQRGLAPPCHISVTMREHQASLVYVCESHVWSPVCFASLEPT